MIYVEHKELSKENYSDLFKWYSEKLKEIQDRVHIPSGAKYYVFEDKSKIRINKTGIKEDRTSILFPRTSSYNGYTWAWCTSTIKDTKGNLRYQPEALMFKDKENLNPDNLAEAQKIFYYMYISPTAKRSIGLVNEEKRAAAENAKLSDEATVKFLILSDQSPLSLKIAGNEEPMRYIALGNGVSRAYELPYEVLKKTLLEKITQNQNRIAATKKGYKEFIHEAYNLPDLALRVDLQIALDVGLIEVKNSKCQYKETGKGICVIPPHHIGSPLLAVEEFFSKHYEVRDELLGIVEEYKKADNKYAFARQENDDDPSKNIPPEFIGYTKERVDKLTWYDTLKTATELGYKKKNTDKMDDIKREICQILQL